MKKSILFVCALVVCAMANAKPMAVKAIENRSFIPEKKVYATAQLQKELKVVDNFAAPAAATAMPNGYYISPYQWVTGTPSSGLGYVQPAAIYLPYCKSVTYSQINGVNSPKSTWTVDGKTTTGVSLKYETGKFGAYELPTLHTPDTTIGGKTYTFNDYQFGKAWNDQYADYGFKGTLKVAPGYAMLSQALRYSEEETEGWLPYVSWVPVGADPLGDYAYGTHLQNPYDNYESEFDTIFSVIYNQNTMYIEGILVDVFTQGEEIMGDDDEVTLGIYDIDDEGKIDWSAPLYTATATKDNYIPYYEGHTEWFGSLVFTFIESDPFGGDYEIPAMIDGNFVVAFMDFNDGDEDFGIFADYYNVSPYPNAYFRGKLRSGNIGETDLWSEPSSLNITFMALIPEFVGLPQTIGFGKNGGEQTFMVSTNVNPEYIFYEGDENIIPDWVTIDTLGYYKQEYDEDEKEYYTVFSDSMKLTIKVGANAEVRNGQMTLNVLGRIYNFTIAQGAQIKVEPDSIDFGKIGAVSEGSATATKNFAVTAIAVKEGYTASMQTGTYFSVAKAKDNTYTVTATFASETVPGEYTDTVIIAGKTETDEDIEVKIGVKANLVLPKPSIEFSTDYLKLDSLAISASSEENDIYERPKYFDITTEFVDSVDIYTSNTRNLRFGYDENKEQFYVKYRFLKGDAEKVYNDTIIIKAFNKMGDQAADTMVTEIKAVYMPGYFQLKPETLEFGEINLAKPDPYPFDYISVMPYYLASKTVKVKESFATPYFKEKESMRTIEYDFPADTPDGFYTDEITYTGKDAHDVEATCTLTVTATVTGGQVALINVKAINDNKVYNVLGNEVNEDYKGVVIKNGVTHLQ